MPDRPVVVVGGLNVDLLAHTAGPAVSATSNPGRVQWSAGGVGRNIAENLARLGSPVRLVGAIGSDEWGERLAGVTAGAGVELSGLVPSTYPTGTYLAVLDHEGELVIAVADMSATDELTVAQVEPVCRALAGASLLVLDANLPGPVCAALLDAALAADVPVVADPVSVVKGAAFATVLQPARPLHTVTPNADELAAMTGLDVTAETALQAAAAVLHQRGVRHVWVRQGGAGSVLSSWIEESQRVQRLPAGRAEVVDVTGAGDSATAGYVHALRLGAAPAEAAAYGHAVAALTAESVHTVRSDLTDDLVRARLHQESP